MNKIFYYLFGSTMANIYADQGFEALIAAIQANQDSWTVFRYNRKEDHPSDLLDKFDGWGGWAELTKKEYDQLLPLLDPNI